MITMLLQQFTQIAVKAVEHRQQGNPLRGGKPVKLVKASGDLVEVVAYPADLSQQFGRNVRKTALSGGVFSQTELTQPFSQMGSVTPVYQTLML
jgi:hypothetical protein